jgi:hypothetical protein
MATLPTPDVTWLLHASGRMLDGARLGVDVVENSPPVILWLKMPAVLLARTFGWDTWFVWIGAVALLGVGSLALARRLLPRIPLLGDAAGPVLLALAVGLFLLPRQDFGQREHVAACLILPWLLTLAVRLDGVDPPTGWAWPLALAGGLGLSIKPHFGLVWLAVAAVVVWRRRTPRALLLAELAGAALVPVLALVTTMVLHPQWLSYARIYGPLYGQFGRENPLWVGLVGEGVEWSWIGILGLLAFAPAIRPWPQALSVLLAGLVGFHLAAAVQMKGWGYHFLPAGVLGVVLATAAGACTGWRGDRLARKIYRVAVPAALAFAAWGGVSRTARLLVNPDSKWSEADPSLRSLLGEVRRSGRRETLLVLSTNIGSGFPLAHLSGAGWTLRHPSLWALGAIYADELGTPGVVRTKPPLERGVEERRVLRELEEDIGKRHPTIVLAPRPAPEAPNWAVSQRFEYAPYLEAVGGAPTTSCTGARPIRIEAYLVWWCR